MNKKKILNAVLKLFLIGLISIVGCSKKKADTIDEDVYKQRLLDFLVTSPTSKEAKDVLLNLEKFSKEYPKSVYADDADYIILFLNSIKKIDVELWQEFYDKYPDGKLEPLTKEKLKNFFGYEIYIPYKYLMLWYTGLRHFLEYKNYNEAIKYFSDLAQKLKNGNEEEKLGLRGVYRSMLIIYDITNDEGNYKKIKIELLNEFPDDKQFVDKREARRQKGVSK